MLTFTHTHTLAHATYTHTPHTLSHTHTDTLAHATHTCHVHSHTLAHTTYTLTHTDTLAHATYTHTHTRTALKGDATAQCLPHSRPHIRAEETVHLRYTYNTLSRALCRGHWS